MTQDRVAELRKLIILCSDMFLDIPGNRAVEEAVSWPFQQFPTNTNLGQVLSKVILLNSLYATGIMNVQKMAGHICSFGQELDAKLERGDLSAVEDIRIGHGILMKKGTEPNFYSFATKYAHWQEPSRFPIFDSLVCGILPRLNKQFGFHQPFYQYDLWRYPVLKAVLDSLAAYLNLPEYRYKGIDKGLWVYGKAMYTKGLPEAMSAQIKHASQAIHTIE